MSESPDSPTTEPATEFIDKPTFDAAYMALLVRDKYPLPEGTEIVDQSVLRSGDHILGSKEGRPAWIAFGGVKMPEELAGKPSRFLRRKPPTVDREPVVALPKSLVLAMTAFPGDGSITSAEYVQAVAALAMGDQSMMPAGFEIARCSDVMEGDHVLKSTDGVIGWRPADERDLKAKAGDGTLIRRTRPEAAAAV